jgi:hypothetical protein
MSELEQIKITERECYMLNMIRGLHQDVLYMVIQAKPLKGGGFLLEGTRDTIRELQRDLYDEMELKPSSRTVKSLLSKIFPHEEGDW